ncbi:plasmid mobilization protein [Actinomyces faecalis]|uniref:plasmid mobilization protein n=1 Tax=Actinomyces faecalis TaxID=2722820 RepID=UPI001556271C|nr:plasmid mobilization relaxosome protein MobC [Actinomyces faecalis]
MSTSDEERAVSAPRYDRRRSARLRGGQRRKPLTVYLSDEERELLELRSEATGESMAKILVDAALRPSQNPVVAPEAVAPAEMGEAMAALRDMRRDLDGIGNNLNQIAYHANTVSEVPADFTQVVELVHRAIDDINDILIQVRR